MLEVPICQYFVHEFKVSHPLRFTLRLHLFHLFSKSVNQASCLCNTADTKFGIVDQFI